MKKKVSLLIACLLFAMASFAQLTTQASGYEKSFWQYIEKLKTLDVQANRGAYQNSVTQAETNLKQLKKYAPTYDVSKHEAALQPYKASLDGAELEKRIAFDRADVQSTFDKIGTMPTEYERKAQIQSAERALTNFKTKYPSADASAFDKLLAENKAAAPIKGGGDSEGNASNTGAASPRGGASTNSGTGGDYDNEFETEFQHTFRSRTTGIIWPANCEFNDNDIAKMNQNCDGFRSKFNGFANSAIGQKGRTFSADSPHGVMKNMIDEASAVDGKIEDIKRNSNSAYRESIVRAYFKLLYETDYWTAVANVFPQVSQIQDAKARLVAVKNELGSLDNWLSRMSKAHDEVVENRTIQPAGAHDAAMEAEFKSVYLSMGWESNVTQINLWAPTWKVEVHEITKVPLYRWRMASIVTPGTNGRCWVHEFGLKQVYSNGAYGKSVPWHTDDDKYEMLCSKIK